MVDPFRELNKPEIPEDERMKMAFEIFQANHDKLAKKGLKAEEQVDYAFRVTDTFIKNYLGKHLR